MYLLYLSSGLFLGWSLGANDAANVFGTAVGTKMLRFNTAALTCSIFVIVGAVIGGGGAAHTLGTLGAVNAMAGSFMVACAAAFTVFWMSNLKVPVSTSQAIVGAIIGWNLYTDSLTDYNALTKIVATWIACPFLAAIFAIFLFFIFKNIFNKAKIHLIELDLYTRIGLLLVGAFGAYSLGANNIANVMGVFVSVSPFNDLNIYGLITLSSAQQLFFLGGIAIAVGVFTYSRKVMETVGSSLFKLSPESALVVVLSHALVLFLFSSEGLENWLISHELPAIPLVPVSSTQAIIGAIIGIGIIKGAKGINYEVLREIATGWITTPIIAGIITFIALFFMQNVFNQKVSHKTIYTISEPVIKYLEEVGIQNQDLSAMQGMEFENPMRLESILKQKTLLDKRKRRLVIEASENIHFYLDSSIIASQIDPAWFTPAQIKAIKKLQGRSFNYKWQFMNALEKQTDEWKFKKDTKTNKIFNKEMKAKRRYLLNIFQISE